jgi:hypothetical protein
MATVPVSSGIEVTAKFWLWFLLFLWPPVIVVDGQETKGRWNSPTRVAASPGTHRVRIFYRYYWLFPASPAETDVDVPASGVRQVTYKAAWLVFLPGKVSVAS